MNINVVDYKGEKIVALEGEIDMYSSPELREKLMGILKDKAPLLFIDFSKVSYIDSSGIATFVEGLKYMKAYGGRLRFFSIPRGIMEIFRFSKLDKVFEMFGKLDDAVSS
ncbi:MAG: STAS domain-containing protein [Nitrospirota bacterium]